MVKKLEKKYDHIRWYPENLNPASLREFTDLAITSHGTVGAEYPSFGIPCIVAENSSCSGYKFILQPKNVRGYEQLLKKANSIRRLKKKDMEDAKVFMFIFNILLKNNFSIMPDYILSRKIDEKELWHQLSRKLKDFNLKNDQFKKQVNTTTKPLVSNLPSTYVKQEKPSFINSLFLVSFIIILIIIFWLIKNEEPDLSQLIKFYILEFYFNLQLIINDIAKLTYQIFN